MGNMGYCRFRNTDTDLSDCEDHFDNMHLSAEEHNARVHMVETMIRILTDYGAKIDMSAFEDWLTEKEI